MTKFKKTSKDLGHGSAKIFQQKKRKRKWPLRADDEGLDFLAFILATKDGRLKTKKEFEDDESRYRP